MMHCWMPYSINLLKGKGKEAHNYLISHSIFTMDKTHKLDCVLCALSMIYCQKISEIGSCPLFMYQRVYPTPQDENMHRVGRVLFEGTPLFSALAQIGQIHGIKC